MLGGSLSRSGLEVDETTGMLFRISMLRTIFRSGSGVGGELAVASVLSFSLCRSKLGEQVEGVDAREERGSVKIGSTCTQQLSSIAVSDWTPASTISWHLLHNDGPKAKINTCGQCRNGMVEVVW